MLTKNQIAAIRDGVDEIPGMGFVRPGLRILPFNGEQERTQISFDSGDLIQDCYNALRFEIFVRQFSVFPANIITLGTKSFIIANSVLEIVFCNKKMALYK